MTGFLLLLFGTPVLLLLGELTALLIFAATDPEPAHGTSAPHDSSTS